MEFERVIKEREAVRSFSDKKVENDLITKILEAGNLAPTAKNQQPQKILVVTSEEGLKKIDNASPCRYNAPCVLVVCSDKTKAFNKGSYSTYEMDATIVATHMMLEATNIGVDNIWIEMFDGDIIKSEFELGENIEPVMLLPIGYRNESYPGNPMHNIRKSLSEIVEYK